MTRRLLTRGLPVAVITGVMALTGCGASNGVGSGASGEAGDVADGGADATWRLEPGQVVTDDTTDFTALVSRLACNSGVTGEVNEPSVDEGDDEVTITFTVSPDDPEAADCQGNDEVPYEVRLSAPLAGRALVDGACASTDAAGLVFCEPTATRSPSPATPSTTG